MLDQFRHSRWLLLVAGAALVGLSCSQLEDESLSGAHSCAVLASGKVYCWGLNNDYQLGDGTQYDRSAPVEVVGLSEKATSIATTYAYSCALLRSGSVECWGIDMADQSGRENENHLLSPRQIMGLNGKVGQISAGAGHVCVCLEKGTVQCWGSNSSGELGDGTTDKRVGPVEVVGLTDSAVMVTAGGDHNCALLANGSVWCWGNNFAGQLGDGTFNDSGHPVQVLGLDEKAVHITAGRWHNCAVLERGSVQCWGYDDNRELGRATLSSRCSDYGTRCSQKAVVVEGLREPVVSVHATSKKTCALNHYGKAICWGILSRSEEDDLSEEGEPPTDFPELDSGVSVIALGNSHECVVMSKKFIKCRRGNYSGQLGNDSTAVSWSFSNAVGLEEETVAIDVSNSRGAP